MYSINWQSKARKQLSKIDSADGIQILNDVKTLANWPNVRNIKALVKHKYGFRLKVGKYRVLLDIDTNVRIVAIQEVKKRDGNTY